MNFNNLFYLIQYVQNIFSACDQYKTIIEEIVSVLFIILSFRIQCISYTPISVGLAAFQVLRSHVWLVGIGLASPGPRELPDVEPVRD